MRKIYLDNCATTAAGETVAEKVRWMMTENFGNPSSLHGVGSEAYMAVNTARHQVAKVLAAHTSHVYFTSGGTESNNFAIFGAARSNMAVGKNIVTTAIEHSSVRSPIARLESEGFHVSRVAPRSLEGCISAGDIIEAVDDKTSLLSFMYVNNETGEILPVRDIIAGVRKKNPRTLIHCDCVQGFGKLPFRLFEYDVDFLSASAHKLHGPKGVGCLYIKDLTRFSPGLFGGSQESGVKPGTENTALIAGFGEACDEALLHFHDNLAHAEKLRAELLAGLKGFEGVRINSPEHSSPYIVNFSLPGYEASDIVSHMSSIGIYISAGSACSRGARSHVISALGRSEEEIAGALRLSFSRYNSLDDIAAFLESLKDYIRRSNPRRRGVCTVS